MRVPPAPGPWRYLALPGGGGGAHAGFGLIDLAPGQSIELPAGAPDARLETVVVPLRAPEGVRIHPAAGDPVDLPGRVDVWDEPASVAYLAPGRSDRRHVVTAGPAAPASIAFGWAQTVPGTRFAADRLVVPAKAVSVERRGDGPTERFVRHLYEGDRPAAGLLVVEVVTPPGHWSSFPPHRHDDPVLLEEFYYCEVRPAGRAAYLHVFTERDGPPGPPIDEVVAARDGDLVLVRRGYHTAATPPGTELYYLNVMAGAARTWTPVFHPAYADLVVGWERAPIDRPAASGR